MLDHTSDDDSAKLLEEAGQVWEKWFEAARSGARDKLPRDRLGGDTFADALLEQVTEHTCSHCAQVIPVIEPRRRAADGGWLHLGCKAAYLVRKKPDDSPLAIALDLIRRGIAPVPVSLETKKPFHRSWQRLRITAADAAKYFGGKDKPNVGAIMGPASSGLTDIDLDCWEAMALAPYLLPKTKSVYGRPGKRRSHYLYTCLDPEDAASRKWQDELGKVIIELRLGGGGKGAQSVMPGSVHPSGERYAWDEDGIRAAHTCGKLKAATTAVAVGALIVRHWPPLGGRHNAALVVGGFLARAGWSANNIEHFVVSIVAVHKAATDPGNTDIDPAKHGQTARDAHAHHAGGGNVFGFPAMVESFGEAVAKKIAKHLDYKSVKELPEPPQGESERPVAEYGPLSKMADKAAEILIAAKVSFYQRGDMLVRPVVLPVKTFHGETTHAAQLVEVELSYMRDILCRKSKWVKADLRSRSWVDIHPPAEAAQVLLSRFGEWPFPFIAGIISTPTMRPDGTILSIAGYDPATRLLLIDPPPMPEIPEHPTRDDALAALALLKGLLVEFPFVDGDDQSKPNISRSVALSAYLTTVCRAAFPVAPMHAGDATMASSGKSYLLNTVALIATGQDMPVISAGKHEEEMEKRIGAAVIQGQSLICIDNVVDKLGGDALCQLVEQARAQVRKLQESLLVEATGITYFADGNNIVIYGDFCRRVVRYRLDPKLEQPELRQFKGNPKRDILTDRGAYIAAALTVCRAYIAAGRPEALPQLASFGGWSDTVRSALVWLGEADPVASMDTSRAEDPEKNALITMLEMWAKTFKTTEENGKTLQEVVDCGNLVTKVDPATNVREYAYPGLRTALQAIMPARDRNQLSIEALGYWMRGKKDRRIGGKWFKKKDGAHGEPSVWWVEVDPLA